MEKAQVIDLLTQRFHQVNGGITFELIQDGMRQTENWWQVPVLATRNGKDVPHQIAVNIFATVESELETNFDLSVLIIPVTSPD
jgi:hypothetical protein